MHLFWQRSWRFLTNMHEQLGEPLRFELLLSVSRFARPAEEERYQPRTCPVTTPIGSKSATDWFDGLVGRSGMTFRRVAKFRGTSH
jgi:hypothetical protein